MSGALVMWTIYDHPADYPESWVLRRSEVSAGVIVHDARPSAVTSTLKLARVRIPAGCVKVQHRDPVDPNIAEVWV